MTINLQVERPQVIWRQVAEQMRQQIVTGQLAPGTRLPSTTELAEISGTDIKTVHRALTALTQEGLISRVRKVGSHVLGPRTTLTSIGLYYGAAMNAPYSRFMESLHTELQKHAYKRGIETHIWVDQRPREEQITPLPGMLEAARTRQIQGVIMSISDPIHLAWREKMRVPSVHFGSGNISTSVQYDTSRFIKLAVQSLREQGCKTCGVITSHRLKSRVEFFTRLNEECTAQGIEHRPEWTFTPSITKGFPDQCYEPFGYESFHTLWSRAEHPDGLIVYPDIMARGVIMAALELQAQKSMKFVIHKNAEVGLFCPLPATFVTTSVSEAAATLLNQLDDCFHGRATKKTHLDYSIEPQAVSA